MCSQHICNNAACDNCQSDKVLEDGGLTQPTDKEVYNIVIIKGRKTWHRPDLTILSSDLLHNHTVEVLDDLTT